jgi:hypothetical protein
LAAAVAAALRWAAAEAAAVAREDGTAVPAGALAGAPAVCPARDAAVGGPAETTGARAKVRATAAVPVAVSRRPFRTARVIEDDMGMTKLLLLPQTADRVS